MFRSLTIALAIASAVPQARADAQAYWVVWDFDGEPCRQAHETPDQFLARRRENYSQGFAEEISMSTGTLNVGGQIIEISDHGQKFRFWTDITSCRSAFYQRKYDRDAPLDAIK